MRKYIKKQILGIVKSLFDANQLLKKLIIKGSSDKVNILLQDMQAAAIEVGETIEKNQEEGTETVHLLEELCELIWETSQAPMNVKSKLCKEMQKKLDVIRKQIEAFPAKTEVVFLPYKASMWDSLESVWMAADEDENCDAYVIPIPYYDKNPDGKLGEMHYEGDKFPKYVIITEWEKYDFEGKHPDIIYFHNPYDEYNRVTSVHPHFYSNKLKSYTDKLIYIPYYVCSERTRKENCVQKGVLYADKVIVQSDNIKKEYVKYCKETMGDIFSSDKVLALGAPKFDKIIRNDGSLNDISEEWKKYIENKKVILYNTHLNIFLRYGEAALKKLESVFMFFKQRSDMVLLWRPHPLCKATLEAMKPELFGRYKELERKYISEKIGIYDDGEDMYPALSIADAYYGDESSLINVFGITGKPVCIQNVNVTDYYFGEGNLSFEGAYVEDDLIYFSNKDFNQLAYIDMENRKISLLGEFPDFDWKQQRITQNIGMWKNKLWMMPFNAKEVFKYDLSIDKWFTFSLPEPWPNDYNRQAIFAGVQIDKYYYGFCCSRYGVMKLDMETGELTYCRDSLLKYKQIITEEKSKIVCRQDCCVVQDKIYAACMKGNIIIEYATNENKIQLYQVGDRESQYITISYDGKLFWLTDIGGKIIKWNKKTGNVQQIEINVEGYRKDSKCAFASSLYSGGYIWLFAYSANMNIRINTLTDVMEEVYGFSRPYGKLNLVRVLKSWVRNDKIYFVDSEKFSIVEIDPENVFKSIPIYSEGLKDIWKYFWEPEESISYLDYIHREKKDIYKQLGSYVQYIKSNENMRNEKQKEFFLRFTKFPGGNSGEMIHRKMMEE